MLLLSQHLINCAKEKHYISHQQGCQPSGRFAPPLKTENDSTLQFYTWCHSLGGEDLVLYDWTARVQGPQQEHPSVRSEFRYCSWCRQKHKVNGQQLCSQSQMYWFSIHCILSSSKKIPYAWSSLVREQQDLGRLFETQVKLEAAS